MAACILLWDGLHRLGASCCLVYSQQPRAELKTPHTRTSPTYYQVFVGWLKTGTAVLAFRGTSNRADALMDVKFFRRLVEFLPHQFPGAKAHLVSERRS